MLHLRQVGVQYPGAAHLTLSDVSLAAEVGVTWLVGRNAAGKTTLLRAIAGDIPTCGGCVEVGGVPVDARGLRSNVTFVPDEETLPSFLTANEVLDLAGRAAGRQLAPREVAALLQRFDIDIELGAVLLGAASYGTRRKVRMAVGLLAAQRVVLLDEPFVGLDPHAVGTFVDVVRSLVQRGRIVLISSHHLDVIRLLGGSCYVVDGGTVSPLPNGTDALDAWVAGLGHATGPIEVAADLLAPVIGPN